MGIACSEISGNGMVGLGFCQMGTSLKGETRLPWKSLLVVRSLYNKPINFFHTYRWLTFHKLIWNLSRLKIMLFLFTSLNFPPQVGVNDSVDPLYLLNKRNGLISLTIKTLPPSLNHHHSFWFQSPSKLSCILIYLFRDNQRANFCSAQSYQVGYSWKNAIRMLFSCVGNGFLRHKR